MVLGGECLDFGPGLGDLDPAVLGIETAAGPLVTGFLAIPLAAKEYTNSRFMPEAPGDPRKAMTSRDLAEHHRSLT